MPRTSKWAARPASHRAAVIKVLQEYASTLRQDPKARKKNGPLALSVEVAVAALTVRAHADARPSSPEWKLLSAQLRVDGTKASAISKIAKAVAKAGGVEKGAAALGVHHRTLFRRMSSMPELVEAIRKA